MFAIKVNITNESSEVPSGFSSFGCDNSSYKSMMSPKWKKGKINKIIVCFILLVTVSKVMVVHKKQIQKLRQCKRKKGKKNERSGLRKIIELLCKKET